MATKKYSDEGMRLTDCCGCVSTFCDETLCCKGCWKSVPHCQGDGLEYRKSSTCVNCGSPTTLGDCCEECCVRDCDICGKDIDMDMDSWVLDENGDHLNIHPECIRKTDIVIYGNEIFWDNAKLCGCQSSTCSHSKERSP